MQSSLTSTPPSLIRRYHVASVDKAQSPPNGSDGDWYRYVLAGGRTPITGLRRGTLNEVTEHARRCVRDLNDRNSGKRLSAWGTRRTKASASAG
ncbi:hypothetical protein TI04_03280 [Achromatium sp. WMS2]|nr:hypothetical protein TI04_03280 [Achromatium sp. WMS2]